MFSSWEEFIGHIGPRTNGMSLDRIDNEGNYEPGNVRWAKQETQQNNKRTNLFVTYRGQRKTVAQWARVLGAPKTTLLNRVHSGLPFMP